MLKRKIHTLGALLCALSVSGAIAAPDDHSSRKQAPPLVINDPINTYVRTVYPSEAKTVREAVVWLLEGTQWSLQEASGYAPPDAPEILAQRIDPIAQLPRTMTRLDAIQILIGTNNAIVLDRGHRLISFTAAGVPK